ncbi:Uncharacterised protein [Amycolatopsis camponoti]|uniref:K(+)-transporting ATPase subunit F n=1 Tax=Amycolatopsis camponoti TaxID=2606593 RepID=A0A6I8LYG3_9PSEU|nr:Uncharacterised protein [Amycolatopsis camponoti]
MRGACGRLALRRPDDRRVRGARAGAARAGEAVSGAGTVANVVGGLLALGLLVYLFVALIKPEKF